MQPQLYYNILFRLTYDPFRFYLFRDSSETLIPQNTSIVNQNINPSIVLQGGLNNLFSIRHRIIVGTSDTA